jgi:hypothetical protein
MKGRNVTEADHRTRPTQARTDGESSAPARARPAVDLAVPAYAHPAVDPDLWERLAQASGVVRFVVVNVHSGPGELLDPAYPAVIERLRDARIRMVGYVDTDYGRRPVQDVVADARTWVLRYGVHGVFLDQASGDLEQLEYYAACALGARACGAQFVVLNPGADCHPGYADIANVTVTFEGRWADYWRYRPAAWTRLLPASRFCHLVYDAPAERLALGPALARQRHASTAFFTSGTGANPWDRLPDPLVRAVARARPEPAAPPTPGVPSWGERRFAVEDGAQGAPRGDPDVRRRRRWLPRPGRLRLTPPPPTSSSDRTDQEN